MTTVIAFFLILHGLVHGILALVPNPNEPEAGFARFFSNSWLLSSLGLSDSFGRAIAILLAAIAAVGFIATGLALLDLLVPYEWWRSLAIVSAAISLVLLIIFWNSYLVFGVVIDVLILVALVFFNWTPD